MAFPQFVDYAVYQPNTESYAKELAREGAKGSFIQLVYGTGYPNPKAGLQLHWSLKHLAFTGLYQFFLGDPIPEAKCFLAWAHHYGMDQDKSTPVMLDVEPNQSYNGPQTRLINEWTHIVYKYGFHNIFIYSMASWINDGYHVKPELLTHGKLWVAAYNNYAPGVPHASAWQYTDNWHGMHTDGDMLFVPLASMTGDYHRPVEYKAKPKKHVSHYLSKGNYFLVTGKYLNGFEAENLQKKNGNFLVNGTRFHGEIVSDGKVKRIKSGLGYFSANDKFVKAI